MNSEIERILKSYEVYYDIEKEDVDPPFVAEATFHSHDKNYFLVKRATIAEIEQNEFVFFAIEDNLTQTILENLIQTAWERGLAQVIPSTNHRNSDIVLIILTKEISQKVIDYITQQKLSKNYFFSLKGWSDFLLVVKDTTNNQLYLNKFARNHKDMFEKII